LRFIEYYPTPQAARELSWDDFAAFGQKYGYAQAKLPACFVRLKQPYPQASSATVASYLATQLQHLTRSKNQRLKELSHLFAQHPDQPIFASLPGAGVLLAPALLSKFGYDRAR
jgi:hypothetical protein